MEALGISREVCFSEHVVSASKHHQWKSTSYALYTLLYNWPNVLLVNVLLNWSHFARFVWETKVCATHFGMIHACSTRKKMQVTFKEGLICCESRGQKDGFIFKQGEQQRSHTLWQERREETEASWDAHNHSHMERGRGDPPSDRSQFVYIRLDMMTQTRP